MFLLTRCITERKLYYHMFIIVKVHVRINGGTLLMSCLVSMSRIIVNISKQSAYARTLDMTLIENA